MGFSATTGDDEEGSIVVGRMNRPNWSLVRCDGFLDAAARLDAEENREREPMWDLEAID